MEKFEKYEEFKCIKPEDLTKSENKGWRICEVLDNEEVMTTYSTQYDAQGRNNTTHAGHTHKKPLLIIGRDRDSAVSYYEEALDKLVSDLKAANAKASKAEEDLKAAMESLGTIGDDYQRQGNALALEEKKYQEVLSRYRTMEKDIQRIRRAIGEKAMNEILGAE